jgi:hypothetical protein
MSTNYTFTNYLEAVFFEHMDNNSICPFTHEGIEFYFGKIYERIFDHSESEMHFDIREDLAFLIQDAKEMQANKVKLGFTRGIPYVAPY